LSLRLRTAVERLALIVLGVALETLATPPGPAPALVFVQDAPFLLLLWHRGGAGWKRWAFLYAFVRFAVGLRWLAEVHPGMVFGASAVLAVLQLAWGGAIRLLVRRRAPYVLAVAVTAVLLEMAQTVVQGASGMPWPARSLAFAGWPTLRAAASVLGAYGLSALAAATAAWASGLPALLRRDGFVLDRAHRLVTTGLALGAVAVVLAWNGGLARAQVAAHAAGPRPVAARTAPLVVVQAKIEQSLKMARSVEASADAIFDRHLALTVEALSTLAAEGSDVLAVLWPETMVPEPFVEPGVARLFPDAWIAQHARLLALKRAVPAGMASRFLLGVNVVLDAPGLDPMTPFHDYSSADSVVFVDVSLVPDEPPDPATRPATGWPWELAPRHDKVVLVPWGEYAPGGSWLPSLRRVRNAISPIQEITPGDPDASPFLLTLAPPVRSGERNRAVLAGTVVCFEIAFPARCRDWRRRGATVLLNAGNYAWYGDTEMPAQIQAIAQLRAAELATTVVIAGNTGPSCVIDPAGNVYAQVRRDGKTQFVPGWIAAPLSSDDVLRTPYLRFGDVPWWIAGALLAIRAAFGARGRRPPVEPAPPASPPAPPAPPDVPGVSDVPRGESV
jgi:apolipoprotein N-acyltransferase